MRSKHSSNGNNFYQLGFIGSEPLSVDATIDRPRSGSFKRAREATGDSLYNKQQMTDDVNPSLGTSHAGSGCAAAKIDGLRTKHMANMARGKLRIALSNIMVSANNSGKISTGSVTDDLLATCQDGLDHINNIRIRIIICPLI